MSTATPTVPTDALELAHLLVTVTDALREANLDALSEEELVEVAETVEVARRKNDAVDATVITAVSDRAAYRKAGWIRLSQFLGFGLRLSPGEVKRRTLAAAQIGRLTNLQGELLEPALPTTADAVADGEVAAAHVLVIQDVMRRIPSRVPADVVARAEADLAAAARTLSPKELLAVGVRLLAHVDPDGQETADRDRRRHRSLTLGRQDVRLMSRLAGELTPQLRAKLEVILTAWAAPGFNNPDDPESPRGASDAPGLDPALVQAAAGRDLRSPAQRNHDALEALTDFVLGHGALGPADSLSSQLVITADLADIVAGAGIALTATGTRVPLSALVDLAADAVPYLEIFAKGSKRILHFGRGRRLASRAQRLALFGRDRGCTAPGCDRPFSQTQAHHMPDWQHGGPTDIDNLGAACGGHNRAASAGPVRWDTQVLGEEAGPDAGRVGWRVAGRGQPYRTNPIHHVDAPRREHAPDAPAPPATGSAVEQRLLTEYAVRGDPPFDDPPFCDPPFGRTDFRFPTAS